MGRTSAPAPSATPYGMTRTNIATGVKPVPFITPDQNPSTPALSGYTMSPANQQPSDPNDPSLLGGGSGVRDQIQALRGNYQQSRMAPFFGQMY